MLMCQHDEEPGSRRQVMLEKIVSIVLAVGCVFTIPEPSLVKFYFVLGHAHIAAAFLYTYLAGKMNAAYVYRFIFVVTVLFGSYLLYPWFAFLSLVVPVYFLVHFLCDEVHLIKIPMDLRTSPMNAGRAFELAPMFLLYLGQVLNSVHEHTSGPVVGMLDQLGLTPANNWTVPLTLALMLSYAVVVAKGYHRPDWASFYFLGMGAVMFCLQLAGVHLSYIKLISFMVLVHVLNWYIHYFLRLRSAQGKRRVYVWRMLGLNLLSVAFFAGAFFGWLGPLSHPVGMLFEEAPYNLWSLVHLYFSTRLADFSGMFRW